MSHEVLFIHKTRLRCQPIEQTHVILYGGCSNRRTSYAGGRGNSPPSAITSIQSKLKGGTASRLRTHTLSLRSAKLSMLPSFNLTSDWLNVNGGCASLSST